MLRFLLAFLLFFPPAVAWAGEIAPPPAGMELRLGLFLHDMKSPERGSLDVQAGTVTALPVSAPAGLPSWIVPKLDTGAAFNTARKTSHVHMGLLWQHNFAERLFAEAGIGAAFHTGVAAATAGRAAMGCRAAFRETAGIGYRLTEKMYVMLAAEHLSNAGLCRQNRGLTNYGIRLGRAF